MSRTHLARTATAQRDATGARGVDLPGLQARPDHPSPAPRPIGEESSRPQISRWLLFALAGGALLLFALWAVNPVPCSDLWWQLKTGEIIWNEHAIPRTDRFSFMAAGNPWIIQEWATEVLFYLLFVKISPVAMVFFKILTFAGAMGLALAAAWTRCRSGLLAIAAALFIGYATHFYADMRPQMMSFLFLAGMLLLLEQDRSHPRSHARWLLPPLMLVWVNCHAAFMAGVTVLLAILAGSAIESWLHRSSQARAELSLPSPHQSLRRLLPPIALALLATCVNPYGPAIYIYPFTLLQHNSMVNFVQEWFSPDFHAPYVKPYELCLFLLVTALLVSRRPKRAADLMLLLFWAHESLQSRRHIPVFLILALPVLVDHLAGAAERLEKWSWLEGGAPGQVLRQWARAGGRARGVGDRSSLARGAALALALLIGLGIARAASALPRRQLFDFSAGLSFFPRAACDFIARQGWTGRMYNEFDWGGYCIWRFYPRQQVFIDGRCEVYFNGAWENHQAIHYAQADWDARLRDARVDTLLVNPDSYLNRVLPTAPEWVRVYADPLALVYRRKQPFEP